MFGAVMSWTDGAIVPGLELATAMPINEIEKIKEALNDKKNNPRDFKMKLAFEMVRINHGKKEAQKAQERFKKVFSKKELPDEAVPSLAPPETAIIDIMVSAGLAGSRADAKRKIEQRGVEIGDRLVTDIKAKVKSGMNGKILKVGKKNFRKIVIE